MRDASALRQTRRSTARGLRLVAIAGIALTLFITATAILLTHPGHPTDTEFVPENSLLKQSDT